MKSFVAFTILFIGGASAVLQCEHKVPNVPDSWIDMHQDCSTKVKNHVMEELKASMQYMAMGAHFSQDQINRPGFANLFFTAASEEREHAIKLIHYLSMRGNLTSGVSDMIRKKDLIPQTTAWADGASALRDALELEATVTRKIRALIIACENEAEFNDYHLVDYLTADFLTEQYNGQRDLAGKLSTLDKLMIKHGALGEFLFDKKLE